MNKLPPVSSETNTPSDTPASSSLAVQSSPASDSAETASPQKGRHNWVADLCLIMTAVMWGINIPVVKYAVGHVDPFAFNAVRLVFATLILAVFCTIEMRMGLGILPRPQFLWNI